MRLKDKELRQISGGSDIASTFLKYLTDAVEAVFGIGQKVGGAIRRIATNNVCPF